MAEPTVFLNGLFIPLGSARISVVDRGFSYGDGLFETMRSYNGKIFRLNAHLERLYQSLGTIYLNIPMTVEEMKSAVCETLAKNRQPDCMIRLTVSRGGQTAGFHIDPDTAPTLVILVRSLEDLPKKWYDEGIQVSLYPNTAQKIGGLQRSIKSCNFLTNILIREKAHRENSTEGILMDDRGHITEGTTSNVFIVNDGILMTPAINEHVLPGITRQAVLDIAPRLRVPVVQKSISAEDIYHAEEVFITNSRIEILPVKRVDDRTIGGPGTITRRLHAEFLKTVEGKK